VPQWRLSILIGALLIVTAIAFSSPVHAHAEAGPSWTLRLDNDYFNFWQPAYQRADHDYTQGSLLEGAFPAGTSLLPHVLSGASDGRWIQISLAQEIYTPAEDSPKLRPGQRPYAGWLAIRGAIERQRRVRTDLVAATLGVTGPASLAEFPQTQFHRIFNLRRPLGWDGQLPTEPGFVVEYARADEWVGVGSGSLRARAGTWTRARFGSIAVDGSVAIHGTLGLNPAAPRPEDLSPHRGRVALYAIAWAGLDGVLRNEFLEGTLFRDSERVPIRHRVHELAGGICVRLGRVRAEWVAIHRGREYDTQTEEHYYSSIILSLAS